VQYDYDEPDNFHRHFTSSFQTLHNISSAQTIHFQAIEEQNEG
jgi:hypothetical protein